MNDKPRAQIVDELGDKFAELLENGKKDPSNWHRKEHKLTTKAATMALLEMKEESGGKMTTTEVSRISGVPQTTVSYWDKLRKQGEYLNDVDLNTLVDKTKRRLAGELFLRADQAFERAFDEERVAKASTLQLVTAGGVMIDKARLLAGESTENISMVVHRVEKHLSDIDDLKRQEIEIQRQIDSLS